MPTEEWILIADGKITLVQDGIDRNLIFVQKKNKKTKQTNKKKNDPNMFNILRIIILDEFYSSKISR